MGRGSETQLQVGENLNFIMNSISSFVENSGLNSIYCNTVDLVILILRIFARFLNLRIGPPRKIREN